MVKGQSKFDIGASFVVLGGAGLVPLVQFWYVTYAVAVDTSNHMPVKIEPAAKTVGVGCHAPALYFVIIRSSVVVGVPKNGVQYQTTNVSAAGTQKSKIARSCICAWA